MTTRIDVVPYDPDWPKCFQAEAGRIRTALDDNCVVLHHIGSTSVPGLMAKPKIDIALGAHDKTAAIPLLEAAGYRFKGTLNLPGRFYFTKEAPFEVNLHLYDAGSPEITLHLLFRDYLRANDAARDAYAALKTQLLSEPSSHKKVRRFTGYALGKNDFIQNILNLAGFDGLVLRQCLHDAEWAGAGEILGVSLETIPHLHEDHKYFLLLRGTTPVVAAHLLGTEILAIAGAPGQDAAYVLDLRQRLETWILERQHRSFT